MRILEKGLVQCAVIFALLQATTRTEAAPSNFSRPDFPVLDRRILSLFATNNVLYVGGAFQTVGNRARPYLAALDVRNGNVLDWEPDVKETVSVTAASGDTLYVGFYGEYPRGSNAIGALEVRTARRPPEWNGYVRIFSIVETTTRINALALGHGRHYAAGEWTGRFINALEP